MKKWRIFLVFILMFSFIGSKSYAQENLINVRYNDQDVQVRKVPVMLNGRELESEVPSFIDVDRTMVPIRFFAETLGADVKWDENLKKATIIQGNKEIELFINGNQAVINGRGSNLDSNSIPRLVEFMNSDARTMVPLSFISSTLGYKVDYDYVARIPYIKSNLEVEPEPVVEDTRNKINNIYLAKGSGDIKKLFVEGSEKLDYDINKDGKKLIVTINNAKLEHKDTGGKYINNRVDDKNIKQVEYLQDKDDVKVVISLDDNLDYELNNLSSQKLSLSIVNNAGHPRIEDDYIVIPNGNMEYNKFSLSNPSRIVVDIFDSKLDNAESADLKEKLSYIDGVRVSNFKGSDSYRLDDQVVRFVFDIDEKYAGSDINVYRKKNDLIIKPEKMIEKVETPIDPGKDREEAKDEPVKPVATPPAEKPIPDPIENIVNPGNRTIYIDAGHGGRDPGAVAKDGTREKDIALPMSLKAEKALIDAGYNVVMTRREDVYVDFRQVAGMANKSNADLFISIHANSAGNVTQANGIETLYCPASRGTSTNNLQYPFASTVHDEIIKATGATNRGVKSRPDLAVLNGTKMPAILLEVGFMSNPAELEKLKTGSYQDKIIEALVVGVNKYFK